MILRMSNIKERVIVMENRPTFCEVEIEFMDII